MATQRAGLDRLIRELEALAPEERAQVLSAVAEPKHGQDPKRQLTWDDLRRLRGIVNLGGDAVEDCERLYDDV